MKQIPSVEKSSFIYLFTGLNYFPRDFVCDTKQIFVFKHSYANLYC